MLTWSEGYERAASEPEPVLWQQPTAAALKPPESTLEAPKRSSETCSERICGPGGGNCCGHPNSGGSSSGRGCECACRRSRRS